jgi:hypothetical protein
MELLKFHPKGQPLMEPKTNSNVPFSLELEIVMLNFLKEFS